jgi:hypothetical protein
LEAWHAGEYIGNEGAKTARADIVRLLTLYEQEMKGRAK